MEYLAQCKKVTDFNDSKMKPKTNEEVQEDDESDDSEFNEEEAL